MLPVLLLLGLCGTAAVLTPAASGSRTVCLCSRISWCCCSQLQCSLALALALCCSVNLSMLLLSLVK
jgi:hypothetical protein